MKWLLIVAAAAAAAMLQISPPHQCLLMQREKTTGALDSVSWAPGSLSRWERAVGRTTIATDDEDRRLRELAPVARGMGEEDAAVANCISAEGSVPESVLLVWASVVRPSARRVHWLCMLAVA